MHDQVRHFFWLCTGRDLLELIVLTGDETAHYLSRRDVEDHHGKLGSWWGATSIPPLKSLMMIRPIGASFAALGPTAPPYSRSTGDTIVSCQHL